MIKRIADLKTEEGYCEQLFKTDKRYYRIVRTRKGNWFDIYVNNSEYGEPSEDEKMYFNNIPVRESTIKECKESIKVYDMLN